MILVHGGLYEGMDACRFWDVPGITDGLRDAGLTVFAPDRLSRPVSWREDAAHLAALIPHPLAVVAGSNGCSTALRVALDHPALVLRLVLCWPATCGDSVVDGEARRGLLAAGLQPDVVDALLAGDTVRGVADRELAALTIPVAVVPSLPENIHHQRHTAEQLCWVIPQAILSDGFPEPPRPDFPPRRRAFVERLVSLLSA